MKKLIVFNHKMGLLYDEVYPYIDMINSIDTDNDIIVCPSSIYLEAFENNLEWAVGAQNIHYDSDANHTGEISSDQLKALGVEYVMVGHEERVREFNENSVIVNQKLLASLDANIIPILCFGEDIDEDYHEVLPKTLDAYLKNIDNIDFIIFAYEPVYAIATGALPSVDKISEVVGFIKDYLESKYHKRGTVIYGGSVDSSNAHDIINTQNVDGILVGTISTDIKEVKRIINSL